MSHYKSVSRQIFAIFREFTPTVEGLSLDEAFLDVTASITLFGLPEKIARDVKKRILDETQLTASVGIATNKLVAKIASELDKPDGLSIVLPEHYAARLDPLPASVIPGIGRATQKRLSAAGIRTVRELRNADDRTLEPIFGRFTRKTRDRASGIDARPVVPSRAEKSISAEETYDKDLVSREQMDRELLRLTERTASRLRKANLAASTVQIKIRQSDFKTYTRQRKVTTTRERHRSDLCRRARPAGQVWLARNPGARIRLLGVGGGNLAPAVQPDLFSAMPDEARSADRPDGRRDSRSVRKRRSQPGQDSGRALIRVESGFKEPAVGIHVHQLLRTE